MEKIKKIRWFYAIMFLLIAINTFFIYREFYLFSFLPLGLFLVASAFLMADKLLLALVFMVPLSVPLSEIFPNLTMDMFLPTEPLLALLLFIFIAKLLYKNYFDKAIFLHPVSIGIYFYLIWTFITTLTSTMPLVSLKFFVAKLWFIVTFYFLAVQLFSKQENVKKYLIFYALGLVLVVFYALFRHVKYGIFDEKIAHWSAYPFYKDHTSYGAILAMFIPPFAGMTFYKKYKTSMRMLSFFITILFSVALLFSYSRAAWLGLLVGLGIWIIVKLKIRFSVIASIIIFLSVFILFFGNSIMRTLESNTEESSTKLSKHIQSITNITSDASNLERINRWNSAFRMFQKKPIFGWGPGTYMFQYAPFQISSEKTVISTRKGDMGNAHSEYFGPLCEQGFFGTLSFLLVIIMTAVTGFKVIKKTNHSECKVLGITVLAGLFTYYFHGLVNNFLDTDKASAPFWGFTAILVAIDLYHTKKEKSSL